MPEPIELMEAGGLIAEAARDVVETMFFTSVVEVNEVPERTAGDQDWAVRVDFRGVPSGTLGVRLSGKAARSMAACFLGAEEEELSQQQMWTVMTELANMIAGAALSRLDSEATFHLDPPVPVPGCLAECAEEGALCSLPLESGWMHLYLYTR
jgi:CheY-specific phosphatase CheX